MPITYPLTWDETGSRKYENGISHGVLYKWDATAQITGKTGTGAWVGVPWNGLTSVSESPEGAEKTDLWADNMKYASMRSAETFGGTIEAYTYPEEFESCDGSATLAAGITVGQQPRETFCLCYRTEQGNDVNQDLGYKLHLVYNCTCSPSERSYETINDSPDAITFSWEFDTNPVSVTGQKKPTSLLVIDSTKIDSAKLTKLENALYGTASDPAYLPTPDEIVALIA